MKSFPGLAHLARHVGCGVLTALLVLTAAPLQVDAASVTYQHDAQGRVKKATYDNGTVIDYFYDANGNRTSTVVTPLPPDTTAPSAPGTPSFSNVTMTSARATWSAATDNIGVVGYEYSVNSGGWVSIGNVLLVDLTGLSAATGYTVQVRAKDAASNFGSASSGSFTTPDTAAPSVPTGLAGSAPSSSTVNLSWNASSDNVGVTGYKVFRNSSQIGTTTAPSYGDSGLTGSTTYSYSVSANDAAGNNSAQSGAINVTTPDTIAPSVPTSLSATALDVSRISLSWGGSSDTGGSGLAGYRVYRNGSHITNVGGTSHTDTGLASGTSYSYTVAAYDIASNTSGQSNTASASTQPALTATPSSGSWQRWKKYNGTVTVTPASGTIVVTASGGSGSGYSYSWQLISGDTQTSISNASASSVSWSRDYVANESIVSVWRCRVTDSTGNTADTSVTVTIRWDTLD